MPGRTRPPKRAFPPRLKPEEAFGLLAVLLVAVFAMGGGSRHDIDSLPFLRAFALIAAAIGVLGLDRETLRAGRAPFVLLGALALLMAVQLVPLPPSLWTRLPDRAAIERIDAAIGLSGVWRPLTLSPMKTANSLASLTVPFAVLVLFCQLTERRRRHILVLVMGIAVTSAVTGVLQLLAGPGSGLYLYDVTHHGGAVGLFANRNHHAAFLAVAMLVSLHLAAERDADIRDPFCLVCFAVAMLLFASILGNVSRGGLLCGAVALVLAPLILRAPAGSSPPTERRAWLKPALFAIPALGIVMLFALSQRSPALNRLFADGQTDDLRVRLIPTLLGMARDFQPWGAGFGAFEYAYRMREPAALMEPNYVNNAHDDWLQFIIEGGAGGALLLAGALAWLVWRAVAIARGNDRHGEALLARAWLGLSMLLILGFASLFDYGERPREPAE